MKLYAMRVVKCTCILAKGCPWTIGRWIRWQPKQVEECYGPGGFASWDVTDDLPSAHFDVSEKLARENAADLHRQYLHVTVELLEFALVNTIDVSKELRRDKR